MISLITWFIVNRPPPRNWLRRTRRRLRVGFICAVRAYVRRWPTLVAGFLRTRRRLRRATGAARRRLTGLRRARVGARRRLRLAAIIRRVAAFCAAERRAFAIGFLLAVGGRSVGALSLVCGRFLKRAGLGGIFGRPLGGRAGAGLTSNNL